MEKIKIFRICPAPFHIGAFRADHYLDQKSFTEQIQLFREENLLLPGGWAAAMEEEGFQVFETLYNDFALQAQWCKENKPRTLSFSNIVNDIHFQILKEQIRCFEPDIIFIYAGGFFFLIPEYRQEIRSLLNKKIIITGFWGDELPQRYSYKNYFNDLDFVFCSSSIYEKKFSEAGILALTTGNCFDDTIKFQKSAKKEYEFVFSGTTGYGFPDHIGRYEKIVTVMSKSNLQIWANEPKKVDRTQKEKILNMLSKTPSPVLKFLMIVLQTAARIRPHLPGSIMRMIGNWRRFSELKRAVSIALSAKAIGVDAASLLKDQSHPMANYFDKKKSLRKLFPQRVKSLLPNCSDYYTLIAESKLVLNLHRDEDADVGNIRCFEVTGLGSCLVTDRGRELKEFFDIDNDIVAFETVEECLQKVKFLLSHPEEIERISKNGQQTTLSRHTVRHRARSTAEKLKELFTQETSDSFRNVQHRDIVHAVYDIEKHPISYDIAFFLQAAEIFKKISSAKDLIISILWPKDIFNVPGVSQKANLAVNAAGRTFRIFHIVVQMAELFPSRAVYQIKDRNSLDFILNFSDSSQFMPFPGPDVSHHASYYRLINENPDLVSGFSASFEAHRYISDWLKSLDIGARVKILCITLRQYEFDPQRNSNLEAWEAFLSRIDPAEFSIVIVPDSDHFADNITPILRKYPVFTPACFDVDLRFALYETAYLNMFVNNGPGSAASLSRKIRYLMFKITAPNVPHCSEDFLIHLGYEPGKNPKYASKFQKWVWANDDVETLWREFCMMKNQIDMELDIPSK